MAGSYMLSATYRCANATCGSMPWALADVTRELVLLLGDVSQSREKRPVTAGHVGSVLTVIVQSAVKLATAFGPEA